MTKGYADIPEGQVSYRSEGSGQPLLLLHQTPWSFEEYSLMIPILARTHHVIAMETLGYGYSDDPPREYEVEDFARSVVSFLDALNIAKTSIVGHHTGAIIATEVASAYPERVDKLILSGLPYREPKDWEPLMKEIESQMKSPTEDGSFLIDLWNWIRSTSLKPEMKLLIRFFIFNLDSYTRTYDAHFSMARYNIKPRLPLIKSRTLALSGSDDFFIDELEAIKKAIPRCQTKVIEGTGSALCLEKPEEFASVILEFLGNP
ncbi:MAG: alpha/beta hydrolase [Deltaproteobacteria bacterium]|nr:alpha/beta hydrolase [Deltaproteobacteria bacterium]